MASPLEWSKDPNQVLYSLSGFIALLGTLVLIFLLAKPKTLFWKNIKNRTEIIIAFAVALYGALWILIGSITYLAAKYSSGDETDNEISERSYLFAFYGMGFATLIIFPIIFISLRALFEPLKKYTIGEIFFMAILITIVSYAALGAIYLIHHSISGNNDFHLRSKFLSESPSGDIDADKKALYISIGIPALLFVLTVGTKIYLRLRGNINIGYISSRYLVVAAVVLAIIFYACASIYNNILGNKKKLDDTFYSTVSIAGLAIVAFSGFALRYYWEIPAPGDPDYNSKFYPMVISGFIALLTTPLAAFSGYYDIKEKDFKPNKGEKQQAWVWASYSIAPLILSLMALIYTRERRGNNRQAVLPDNLDKFILFSFLIAFFYGLGISIANNYRDFTLPAAREYTVWLLGTTFTIFASILITFLYIYRYNDKNRPDTQYNYIIPAIFGLIALTFSVINLVFVTDQNIDNQEALKDTQYANHTEYNYKLLNLGMSYAYIILTLISFLTLLYIGMEKLGAKDKISDFANFMTFRKNISGYLTYAIFGTFVIALVSLNTYYLYKTLGPDKGSIKAEDFSEFKNGGAYLLAPGLALFSMLFIEMVYNWTLPEKETPSSFVLKFFRALTYIILFSMPITGIFLYYLRTPTFYEKIDDSSTKTLIFSDSSSKNAMPSSDEDPTPDTSMFSVGSNFASYGNGLFVAGGRTNLDLETTRGILYVENQNGYYNFKYLQNNIDTFDNITKGDGVNLFSFQINDSSYGKRTTAGEAYWVSVGENVGLATDPGNNTIFYNPTAGATSITDIPYIEEINNWKTVTGDFDYRGNGVTCGLSTNALYWVAVGQNEIDFPATNYRTIKYSTDGITWSDATGTSFSGYGNKVAYGPSGLILDSGIVAVETFIAVGYDYNSRLNNILRSTDGGQTWAASTGASFSGEGTDVAYGLSDNGTSGIWVAVGEDDHFPIKYSTDGGAVWSHATNFDKFGKPEDATAVTYNLQTTRFEVVGKKSKTTSSSILYTSQNGSTWTPDTTTISVPDSLVEGTAIAYNKGISPTEFGDQYSKVYYPVYEDNHFFVNKVEDKPLGYFLISTYIFDIIALILFIVMIYFTAKNPAINRNENPITALKAKS